MGDPVPSSAISDATTGGLSVIVITGGSDGDVLTRQADGTYAPETPSSGGSGDVVGPASAVDNAAVRFDATTGKLIQSSNWIIADNLTASPNNTVNHACLEATGGTTNVSVSIKPKGTGSFSLHAPDGTSAGGNVRGANAVDLQTSRSAAAQVASGAASIVMNQLCTASGRGAIAGGYQSVASGQFEPVALGKFATASGTEGSVAIGPENVASASYTNALGYGSTATRHGQTSYSGGYFAAAGDAQRVSFVLRRKTTNNTATTLMLDGSATRLTITPGKILFADVLVCGIKSDGSAAACYKRKIAIKNVGGSTSLVGSVEVMGTDIEDNASTDVTITADNTNDALQIDVTGITSETWRWVAVVEGLEVAYGT